MSLKYEFKMPVAAALLVRPKESEPPGSKPQSHSCPYLCQRLERRRRLCLVERFGRSFIVRIICGCHPASIYVGITAEVVLSRHCYLTFTSLGEHMDALPIPRTYLPSLASTISFVSVFRVRAFTVHRMIFFRTWILRMTSPYFS